MQDLNLHELFKLKPIKKDKEQTHRLTQPQRKLALRVKKRKALQHSKKSGDKNVK
mgnify:CR=1 FL=1|jgi:hypothetical protein